METEYEAKFYPVDKEKIRKKLKDVGAKLIVPERKMRRTMAGQEINPQIECDYIRVRDEGDKITLSAKIHAREDGSLSDQKESFVIVSDYDSTVKILQRTGLKFGNYQENLRESWGLENVEIVIDTWPGLEPYIEIEGESEEKVKKVAEMLELNWEDKTITSVVEIFAKKYDLSIKEALEKLEHITFENNPFENLGKKE